MFLGCRQRAVLLFFVVKPKMLGIMAGLTQVNWGLEEYMKIGFTGKLCHMFPYSARWFDSGYSFMSVYRGLVFYIPLYVAVSCTVFGARL